MSALPAPTLCAWLRETATVRGSRPAFSAVGGRTLSWSALRREVARLAGGLAGLGVARGEVLAFWMSNRIEFHLLDAAAVHLGAASISLGPEDGLAHVRGVIDGWGVRTLITEPALLERALDAPRSQSRPRMQIVCVAGGAPEALGLEELLEAAPPGFDFEASCRAVRPGDPVAVLNVAPDAGGGGWRAITHADVIAEATRLSRHLRLPVGARTLVVAPMSHFAGRLWGHYLALMLAWELTVCRDPTRAIEMIAAARPEVMFAPSAVWRRLRRMAEAESGGAAVPSPPDAAALGLDAVRLAAVGGGIADPRLVGFWRERSVPLTDLDALDDPVAATGPPAPPGAGTSAAAIEAALCATPLIGQACVLGDDRVTNVALLTLDPVGTAQFARRQGIPAAQAAGHRRLVHAVIDAVGLVNVGLAPRARIRRFALLDGEWPPGGDELDGMLEVRRGAVREKYRDLVADLLVGVRGIDAPVETQLQAVGDGQCHPAALDRLSGLDYSPATRPTGGVHE